MRKLCLNRLFILVLLQINVSHSLVEKNELKIGAFNIQIFGVRKMEKPAVVDVLVDIISRYDVVLIQEIRDSTEKAIKNFLDKANQHNWNNPFSMKISRRLWRSSSKEQYAFLYRELSGLKLERDYVYDDKNDAFERQPYIVLFKSSATQLKRFALVGLHVAPLKAVKELQALENVFDDVKSQFQVGDIMLMGDLNAGCSYVPNKEWKNIPIKSNSSYTWWIDDQTDTTVVSHCPYDRFISTGRGFETGIVTGSATVFRFDSAFQLNKTFALNVSDHYPIEFVLMQDSQTQTPSDAYQSRTSVFVAFTLQCAFISSYILL